MKQRSGKVFTLLLVTVFISVAAQAQRFVIRMRPAAPAVVRIAAPGPGYIWVDGDYSWSGGAYVYRPGYWVRPPHRGARWVPGRWKAARGGWYWVPGRWKRGRW